MWSCGWVSSQNVIDVLQTSAAANPFFELKLNVDFFMLTYTRPKSTGCFRKKVGCLFG